MTTTIQEGSEAVESRLLEESVRSDFKDVSLRLRKGNYQHDLANGIASFQLELCFPDVKEIVERVYGTEKADDPEFVRKIQTILKKMEKNDIVRILPKKKPWELQRYALSSFKFIDVDKRTVVLATPEQIENTQNQLDSSPSPQQVPSSILHVRTKILLVISTMTASYIAVLWALLQPIIQPLVFVSAFCILIACAILFGKLQTISGNTD